ncbi:MAG TPA: helix-turn-helix transcriptional regulator, partial [Candidatus Dormibacteraeota bacterium]|nr:helix-turn-helix transcriptional regulator [Candidatus Dormibacteraeota bacterium]
AGALAAEGTPLTAAGVAALSPATVARSVASRLARLGLPAGRLARAVAVLGAGPRLDHAAALAGLDASVAAEAADALVSGGILEPVELSFVHPMLRTSVYTESAPAWRAQAHAIAARLLAAEGATPAAVAAHFMRANAAADPPVVEVLRDAAAETIDAGAPDTAATFLRRALGEPPSPEQHGQVLYELGLAELVGGDPGAIEHLAAALRATSDRPRRARIALALGRAQVGAGSLADADSTLSQAIVEAGDAELVARIETYRCVLGIWSPQFAPTVGARLAELRSLAEGDGPAAHGLLLALAFRAAFSGEPRAEIIAMVDRGLGGTQFEAGNITDPVAWAVRSLTFVDALDRADSVVADMFAQAQRASSAPTFASALVCRAAVAVRRGQIAAAEDDARRAVEIVVTHQLGFLAPQAHAWLGEALLERGELDEAAAVLEGADLTAMRGSRPEALFLHVRGRVRLGRGERAAGLADLRLCRSIQEAVGLANPNVVAWRSTLALALPHAESKEAHALVETELNQAAAIGQPRAIGVALRAKALLADHDSAIPLLREAVHFLEASPSQIEHARALTDLGAALRRANQRAAARTPLREALDLATRCAATAIAVRARDELVATGARPRRTVLVGADALTPTERRVAAMAAAGRSNRDIAEALFVSMKTVATHLGHAYQKLDITAREQLATVVLASPD